MITTVTFNLINRIESLTILSHSSAVHPGVQDLLQQELVDDRGNDLRMGQVSMMSGVHFLQLEPGVGLLVLVQDRLDGFPPLVTPGVQTPLAPHNQVGAVDVGSKVKQHVLDRALFLDAWLGNHSFTMS